MALPPMRIAEEIVLPAREEARLSERSVPGQVEHWAKLGMAVERVLGRELAVRLKAKGLATSIEDALALAGSAEGRTQVAEWLKGKKVRYSADPKRPGVVIRETADGVRTAGRMVKRRFRPLAPGER